MCPLHSQQVHAMENPWTPQYPHFTLPNASTSSEYPLIASIFSLAPPKPAFWLTLIFRSQFITILQMTCHKDNNRFQSSCEHLPFLWLSFALLRGLHTLILFKVGNFWAQVRWLRRRKFWFGIIVFKSSLLAGSSNFVAYCYHLSGIHISFWIHPFQQSLFGCLGPNLRFLTSRWISNFIARSVWSPDTSYFELPVDFCREDAYANSWCPRRRTDLFLTPPWTSGILPWCD